MSKKRIRWEDHPSITLVNGRPRLKVFEEYFVEEGLPKFQKLLDEDMKHSKEPSGPDDVHGSAIVPGWHSGEGVEPRETDLQAAKNAKWTRNRYVALRAGLRSSGETGKRSPFMDSIRKIASWFTLRDPYQPAVSVEDTFRLVKDSEITVTTEELLKSRAIGVALIKRFEQTCQFGMAKKVTDHLDVLAAKIALANRGMCKYITEDQAIEFMTKAERGVQVEFLRYYPEVIPADVGAKMAECNMALLFDNYVVMYYSQDVKPVRLLEEEVDELERHKRRDPILFGTLRGSRDLFYIADWTYKDDDLTLEVVEKALGTIPTLENERIADSQLKVSELMHDITVDVDRAIAEARDRGTLVNLEPNVAALEAAEMAGLPDRGEQAPVPPEAQS